MLRANPPPPFSMLYKKEANSRDRKFNIEKGGGGSIVEIRKEVCLKYSKMTKCVNTFVAHCSFLIIVYRVFMCSVTGNLFRLCFQKELLLKLGLRTKPN